MKHGGIAEILETKQFPGVLGTRDTFGIGKEFYDHKTGQWIDNRRTWEKAGFKDLKEFTKGDKVLEPVVKEQLEKQARNPKKPLPKVCNLEAR